MSKLDQDISWLKESFRLLWAQGRKVVRGMATSAGGPFTSGKIILKGDPGASVVESPAGTFTVTTVAVGSGKYDIIQDEGSALTARNVLNFIGPGVTAADDPIIPVKTDVTIHSATTLQEGSIKLANAIGGSATAPTVKKLLESGGTDMPIGAVADGEVLKRVGGNIVGAAPGGGGGEWTEAGGVLAPTTIADRVSLGATAGLSARLSVDGAVDEDQVVVQGHSTQNNPLIKGQNDSATVGWKLWEDGKIESLGEHKVVVANLEDFHDAGSSTFVIVTTANHRYRSVNGSTGFKTYWYSLEIPWQKFGAACILTDVTFYFTLAGTGQVTENLLYVHDVSGGGANFTDIDNDAVAITVGTSHSFTFGDRTFTADERLHVYFKLTAGAVGAVSLWGVVGTFKNL